MFGYIGEIRMYSGYDVPRNWAKCDGSFLSINSNQELYSLIGTTYGSKGDKFALPDMRGRAPIGIGSYGRLPFLGSKEGKENTQINIAELASHTHVSKGSINALAGPGNQKPTTGNNFAGNNSNRLYSTKETNAKMKAGNVEIEFGETGGTNAIDIVDPTQVVRFIICTYGNFPT